MQYPVETITLTFKDLDHIVIPRAFFEDFTVDSYEVRAVYDKTGYMYSYIKALSLSFILKKEVNDNSYTFPGDVNTIRLEKEALFERLSSRRDITRITLIDELCTEDEYDVIWEDDGDSESNMYQSSYLTDEGNLCVTISVSNDIWDIND